MIVIGMCIGLAMSYDALVDMYNECAEERYNASASMWEYQPRAYHEQWNAVLVNVSAVNVSRGVS